MALFKTNENKNWTPLPHRGIYPSNHFGPKGKFASHEKLVSRSGVRFLFLFVLTDSILLKLNLQKRTSVLGNPPNEKLFVYKKWSTCQKIGDVLFSSYIKATIGQCVSYGDFILKIKTHSQCLKI